MWLRLLIIAVGINILAAAIKSTDCSKPKISVPGAITLEYGYHDVREGSIEAYCSGDSDNLVFDSAEMINTISVNTTAVKATVEPSFRTFWLKCMDTSNNCSDFAWINVNYNPNITNFHCFSNNFETLNCSWNSRSLINNYSLSLLSSWDESIKCQGLINRRQYYSCLWDLSNVQSLRDAHSRPLHVSVKLQMCNIFQCIYRTEDVDLISVTKLNPPLLDIQATGANSFILTWSIQIGSLTLPDFMEIYYVIEFAIAGIQPRVLVSDTSEFSPYESFTNDLSLPCPGKQYTIRVSCRLALASEDYMSDFAYTSVRTEPGLNNTLDPICKVQPVEINPPVMKYKDQLLRQYVEVELAKLEALKKVLKEKVSLIKKYQLYTDENI